jgi:hypothetical protein
MPGFREGGATVSVPSLRFADIRVLRANIDRADARSICATLLF